MALPNVIAMKGTVGPPMPNVVTRLVSVPEMNYDALGTPERGEICVKGNAIFKGYHKNEALTAEVLIDGWLHTGTYSVNRVDEVYTVGRTSVRRRYVHEYQ